MKHFTIDGSDSKPLAIDLFEADTANAPIVIFVHGFKGFKDWGTHQMVAKFFALQGFSFLKFNFSHNGIGSTGREQFDDLESFGKNTFSKELFDLDEVITFALSGVAFPAPSKLFLLGHSRGGGISIIQTAEDHRVNKLITWASISRFNSLWKPEQEIEWRKNGVIYTSNARTKQEMPLNIALLEDLEHHPERLDITSAAKAITKPWLIIHGDSDPAVSIGQAHELHRQNQASSLSIIEGGDHVFGAKHPWIESDLPQALQTVCQQSIDFLLSKNEPD